MKAKLIFISTIALSFLFVAACHVKPNHSSKRETDGKHAHKKHEENSVSLTTLQRQTIGLKLGKVQHKNLTGTVRATGKLELAPQYEADVSAMVGGNISRINVSEGEHVPKGSVIALLEHPNFVQVQANLQRSSAQLAYLKQRYERLLNLHAKGVSSGKDLQKAEAEYLSTKAKVEGLKAKLKILNLDVEAILAGKIYQAIPVVSPIGGYIESVNIRMGEFVAPGDLMFEVVDNSHIHADLMVFEKDILKVTEGQQARFTVSSSPDKTYTATIFTVGKTFEKDPKAVHVHTKINGSTKDLIPGMYIEGQIVVGDGIVNTLPETAIVRDGENSYIFIKAGEADHQGEANDESTHITSGKSWVFKKVPVSTGLKSNGWVEVNFLKPLSDNALIVYNGAYKLISEMNKSETSHSH